MSAFFKAMRTANRLAKAAQPVDATQLVRSVLEQAGKLPGLAGLAKPDHGEGSAALPCMGQPAAFDDIRDSLAALKGLGPQGWIDRRAGQPATDRSPAPVEPGSVLARSFTGPAGSRNYKLFRPDGDRPPAGLLVMLHGCTQGPDDFAAGTRMNAVAQRNDMLVLYPEQPRSANPSGCWNWFEPKDQMRGKGEPGIIAEMTRGVVAEFGVPPDRIFVAGLSAGGAMAAILAEAYPDLYAAVGIHSGLPYGSASDIPSAFAAMSGSGRPARPGTEPEVLGVPVIVFQGDADRTVHRNNADAIVARFTSREAGLQSSTERGTAAGGQAYLKTIGRDRSGALRFEHWTLVGGGHAWSGGSSAGSYTDPTGPDASTEMMRFFLHARA